MHEQSSKQADGSVLVPAHLVSRWEKQISTDFDSLSEKEKESDWERVRKYLPIIISALFGPKLK